MVSLISNNLPPGLAPIINLHLFSFLLSLHNHAKWGASCATTFDLSDVFCQLASSCNPLISLLVGLKGYIVFSGQFLVLNLSALCLFLGLGSFLFLFLEHLSLATNPSNLKTFKPHNGLIKEMLIYETCARLDMQVEFLMNFNSKRLCSLSFWHSAPPLALHLRSPVHRGLKGYLKVMWRIISTRISFMPCCSTSL